MLRLNIHCFVQEDVVAGFLLGCLVAYTFYRQQYPPLDSRTAGEAHAVRAAQVNSSNNPGVETSYSSLELSHGSAGELPV